LTVPSVLADATKLPSGLAASGDDACEVRKFGRTVR
jgi:hypothetical protein